MMDENNEREGVELRERVSGVSAILAIRGKVESGSVRRETEKD